MDIYCIGHQPPKYQLPDNAVMLTPVDLGYRAQVVIPDDIWGGEFDGRVLSEYLQLFYLAAALSEQKSKSNYIYICQYRKFLSLHKPEQKSKNNPYSYVATAETASDYFVSKKDLAEIGEQYLLGPCVQLRGTISSNYSSCHILEDLLGFSVSMRESGRFDLTRCKKFINFPYLIPAPSLGVVNVPFFLSMMSDLLVTWKIFQNNFFQPREGYQRRVGGFLLERLNSFLILEALTAGHIKNYKWANQITVSETAEIELTE